MDGFPTFVALDKEMSGNNMYSVMSEPVQRYKLTTWDRAV